MNSQDKIRPTKKEGWAVVLFFVIFLAGFTGLSLFGEQRGFSENESRYLQTKPEFSWKALWDGTFSEQYDAYLSDQFVARDRWIGIQSESERLVGKKDTNGVYFAKDDYLIEKHEDSQIDQKLVSENIKRLAQFLKRYEEELGADHVYAMLVPTASYVLQEKLPKYAVDFDQEQMLKSLLAQAPIGTVVDVRPLLEEEKGSKQLYYRTDHHWTAYGAFYAYEQFAKQAGFTPLSEGDYNIRVMADDFYGTTFSKVNLKLTPDPIYLFEPKQPQEVKVTYDQSKHMDTMYVNDRLLEKDKYTYYLDGNHALVEIKTNVKNGRRLLVIKDSYAHTFVPFLAEHYETIDMIDFRYFKMNVSDYIRQNEITDLLVLYNTVSFAKDTNTSAFLR